MKTEVIPAILVKTREDLLERINRVKGRVSSVHIDVMDNKFVPNKTVGVELFSDLPAGVSYEFHWMVENPEEHIAKTKGSHLHIVHVEAIRNWGAIKKAAKESGGKIGIAINPSTPLEKLEPYLNDVSRVLVMSVEPGFDGQKYKTEVEKKIIALKKKFPKLIIEVDGGINPRTIQSASRAGADKFAAASAIYAATDTACAVRELNESAILGKREST
ncbi:MAG: ribulose-phosphate 3-epimerase [Candidatus Micrarchaeota archaeon]